MTRSTGPALDAWSNLDAPRTVASWYTEGRSDGVGDRLLMFDNSGATSLELLRFRPELAAAAGFEDALRDRVAMLRGFAHPSFPRVRAVEQLEGGLALVSTFTDGKRLSEFLRTERGRTGIHPTFAAGLIRDLTGALADLQRYDRSLSHGALTTDRIVITPDGRLMIVEHAIGAALDTLKLTPSRHWIDFGLLAPDDGMGAAQLDRRTDVIQLGWIVLSALIGRRMTAAEYPGRADALVDQFVRSAGTRSPALVAALRNWLERALQVRGDAFNSAIDANDALWELRIHSGPQAIPFVARRQLAEAPDAPRELPAIATPEESDPSDPENSAMAVANVIADLRARQSSRLFGATVRAHHLARLGWAIAAALAVIAAVEGFAISRLSAGDAPKAAAKAAPTVLESLTPGDEVIVNGKRAGVTPLEITFTPEIRSVRIKSQSTPAAIDAAAAAPPVVPASTDALSAAASTLANARARRGGLRLVSPIEVQVLEGERVLGSSADGPIVASAGRHELDFINTAVGYRTHQTVTIRAGEIVKLNLPLPDGRVSVNAVPWAQVMIDGSVVGDTPLANLPLTAGEHQITFRHPQLGEQTQRVIVKSNALTRVSATLSR